MPRILAKLRLKSISPVSIGGYDTKMSRVIDGVKIREPFRLNSLKGVWRWWMRAYVAGVAYDNGFNGDLKKIVRCKVDELLGSTESASKFGLKPLELEESKDYCINLSYVKEIPRLKLLYTKQLTVLKDIRKRIDKAKKKLKELLKEKKEQVYEDVLKALNSHRTSEAKNALERCILNEVKETFKTEVLFELALYERPSIKINSDERVLAIGSLVSALKLGGMGKISRRGFGSISVESYFFHPEVENAFKDVLKGLETQSSISEEGELARDVKKLIETTYESAEKVVTREKRSTQGSAMARLPAIPAISKNPNAFSIFLFNKSKSLEEVGKLLTRTERYSLVATLIGVEGRPQQKLKKPLAWILGLPRSVTATRIEKSTGYFVNDGKDPGRRASPLIFSQLNDRVWVATLIMSTDYPEELTSKGKWRQDVIVRFDPMTGQISTISTPRFSTTIDDVIKEIKKYLREKMGAIEVKVFGEFAELA